MAAALQQEEEGAALSIPWDLQGDLLEVGSRWHSAELLSCRGAAEGRAQLGEGREELKVCQPFLLYRDIKKPDPAGMQSAGWF